MVAQLNARSSQYINNTDQGVQQLTLHLSYGAPGIIVNGQKTTDMLQLDWNPAENPLPLPAHEPPGQAPGDGSDTTGLGAATASPANL